ncbi:MAG: glycogen synthase GlgA [Desulfuromonadales bacterium]|nr:glycogen synthase GlgA [Desulfuromonadales bacterium]NIR33880.1 glycogen synthase GlgA [Desulfuromonadales bacterium]NIS40031.1 glycogen synthase GlgA [Desulfuromonadales bacterium]
MKILLASSEVAPFAKSGGLADVAGSLPLALKRRGHDVRLVLPYYRCVAEGQYAAPRTGGRMTVLIDDRPIEGYLRLRDHDGIPVYFIDHPAFFDRDGLYGDAAGDYEDNAARFGFFCRAALHMLRSLDWRPDVLHANDWQTGLMPLLLKTELANENFYRKIASVLTIHNLGYQGIFAPEALKTLGLSRSLYTIDGIEFYHQVSLLKAGVLYADLLTTVSRTYCREIMSPEMGHGFDGILRSRRDDLFGVVNGLDTDLWDPAADPALPRPYSAGAPEGKAAAKAALQEQLGLDVDAGTPVLAVVSRLDKQKGIDLVLENWAKLMRRRLQFILLGTGDPQLMQALAVRGRQYAGRVSVNLAFDDTLARRIYAGADMLLMPSRYEPCGLAQLIALRYGSVPIVRRTGGLADTVADVDAENQRGNGFTFEGRTGKNMLDAIDRALKFYRDKRRWRRIRQRGMEADHSWQQSAGEYEKLYRTALEKRRGRSGQGQEPGSGTGDGGG